MSDKVLPNEEKPIIEVLEEFPDSLSFIFQIPLDYTEKNHTYYMKLGDPVFTPKDTLFVSAVPCMGFNRDGGKLWFSDIFIPRGKELIPCTNAAFLQMLRTAAILVKASPRSHNEETVTNFKALGLV